MPLQRNVLRGLRTFAPATSAQPQTAGSLPITIALTARRRVEAGLRNVAAVHDPHSSRYHHCASQDALTNSYGPTRQAYDAVVDCRKNAGFSVQSGSVNRLTVWTVAGGATWTDAQDEDVLDINAMQAVLQQAATNVASVFTAMSDRPRPSV